VPGDTLRLQTGVIFDRNGHPVPDGTLVQFIQQDRIQGFVNVIAERPTLAGIANLDYVLEAQTGHFRITATSGNARTSLEVDIVIGDTVTVNINTPTPTVTPTPTSTPTPTTTPTLRPTRTPTPTATPTVVVVVEEPTLRIPVAEVETLLGVISGLLLTAGIGAVIGRNGANNLTRIVRVVLWGLVGGLVLYNYYALHLPGSALFAPAGSWAGLLTTLAGGLAAMGYCTWRDAAG
jgi:hypothetical protein